MSYDQMTLDFDAPSGMGTPLEQEAYDKMKWAVSLSALRNQLRRTDVELKHLTQDKSLKEFETQLLRVLTLSRQVQMLAVYGPLLLSGNALAMIFSGVMLGMSATTSVGVMQELS